MKAKLIFAAGLAAAGFAAALTFSCKPRKELGSELRDDTTPAAVGVDPNYVEKCGEDRRFVMNDGSSNDPLGRDNDTAIALTDDLGSKAFDVFKAKCSECHNANAGAGKLNNILDFGHAKSRSALIGARVGDGVNPATATMPPRPPQGADAAEVTRKTLTVDEMKIMKEWAANPVPFPGQGGGDEGLPSSGRGAGYVDSDSSLDSSLEAISPESQMACIQRDFARVTPALRRFIRYVSFTHLYNAGVRGNNWAIRKKAFYKALNSVSRTTTAITSGAVPIDRTYMTIFRVDLRAYRIDPTEFDSLVQSPYNLERGIPTFKVRNASTGAEENVNLPYPIRGDFMMREILRGEKYYTLLKMPKAFNRTFLESLGVNAPEARNNYSVRRGVFNSKVSGGGYRVIEMFHEGNTGLVWNLFDIEKRVNANDPRRDPMLAPFGPCFNGATAPWRDCTAGANDMIFDYEAVETMWQLPNGLFAFAVFDADKIGSPGKGRITVNPVAVDGQSREHTNEAGLSCISCHAKGFMDFRDQIGGQARRIKAKLQQSRNQAFTAEQAGLIDEMYPDTLDINDYLNRGNEKYKAALANIGIKPADMEPEPISVVIQEFERPVTLKQASAELGFSEAQLVTAITASQKLSNVLAVFKSNDPAKRILARDQFEKKFQEIVGELRAMRAGRYGAGGRDPLAGQHPECADKPKPACQQAAQFCGWAELAASSRCIDITSKRCEDFPTQDWCELTVGGRANKPCEWRVANGGSCVEP